MFKDIASLISVTQTADSDGYKTTTETTVEVFVDVKSAVRSEFYAALKADVTISKVFEMRMCDYDDQKLIEHESKRYNIIRTYSADGEIIELNCSDLAV